MPKASYTLSKEQKMRVCEWIKGLQFPDGYAFNLARCVDMTELWMHGMKSHDCHVHPMLNNTENELLKSHYRRPSGKVTSHPCYFVNGIIEEIIQLTYPLIPDLHIVLFKCRWVDPVRGMKAAGASRSQAHQTDDDNEDDNEDNFEDDDTDDDEYELI
ncbi:UNVERIFIED_CONTAM: hypothetical protein Slati_1317000 [Sesamum latifolium]|uniref:Uncharacterized protein n=1 Tax=Sesamum latifolium TaxID=2727402 RepID=A0AAW2XJU3_9LAMI